MSDKLQAWAKSPEGKAKIAADKKQLRGCLKGAKSRRGIPHELASRRIGK
jgi:hypothetical protein